MKYKAREETTHTFKRYVPLQENHSRVLRVAHKDTRDPDTDTPSETQRKARTPKCCARVPKGGEAKRASLRHSTLCYFKHYDFIVVCSEAAQMGCFNFCYYRKIRRPRLEAVFLSPPVRASWSGNCDALSSCKHCFSFFQSLRAFHQHCLVSQNQTPDPPEKWQKGHCW